MRRSFIMLSIIFLFALNSSILNAGAWTQKKQSGFYKLGLRYINATNQYDKDGDKIEIPKVSNLFLSFYGEYGINNQLTLIANLAVLENIKKEDEKNNGNIISESGSNSGIADSEIGLRYRLWQGESCVLSTELILGLPIGDNDNKYGLYTGDGEFNQTINILYGQSFYPLPLYFSSQLGFNNRNEGFSDELRFGAEIGLNVVPDLLIAIKIHGVQTLRNGDDKVLGGGYGFHSNNQRYIAFGPELNYSINKSLGISVGAESAANAANVPSALAFSFGLFYKH